MCVLACVCPCVCGRVRGSAHEFVFEINMYYMSGWYYLVAFRCLIQLDRISVFLTESESELHLNFLNLRLPFLSSNLLVYNCRTHPHLQASKKQLQDNTYDMFVCHYHR